MYILNRPCSNTCLVGAESRKMAGLRQACAPLGKYVSGKVIFCLSISPIKYSNWTSDLLNSNYHARLGYIWQLTLLSKKNGKGKIVCGAKKSQDLNLNANPGFSFAGKISNRGANKTICKGSLLALHHIGAWGGHMDQVHNPTRPTAKFRSSLSISHYSKLLKRGDSKIYHILLLLDFSAIYQQRNSPKSCRRLNHTESLLR